MSWIASTTIESEREKTLSSERLATLKQAVGKPSSRTQRSKTESQAVSERIIENIQKARRALDSGNRVTLAQQWKIHRALASLLSVL